MAVTEPTDAPLTPFAALIASHSQTYKEIPHSVFFNTDCERVRSVLEVVAEIRTSGELRSVLRYTQAPVLGYIYEPLSELIDTELREAIQFVNFWQLPISWITAIQEELAFREFKETGVLAPILLTKLSEFTPPLKHICDFYRVPFTPTVVFSETSNTRLEMLLGRRLFPTTSLEMEPNYELCGLAAQYGLVDLLNHYQQSGCPFNGEICRIEAYIGYYNTVTAAPAALPFNRDVELARRSPQYAVLSWLHAKGVPVDNSDGVFGLTQADSL